MKINPQHSQHCTPCVALIWPKMRLHHYSDVIMSTMVSQITGVSMVCSTVCSDANQRKHRSSASLAFERGIHRWPVTGEFPAQRANNTDKRTFGTCSTPWPATEISVQERRWMPFCESKWPNDLEGQGQCLPFAIPAARIPRCILGANLVILAQIH